MEIIVNPTLTFGRNTTTYPKPPTSHDDSPYHSNTRSSYGICTAASTTLTNRPTCHFPHQILPPRQPRKPRKFKPVKPPKPKPITTTTTSDVLRLMDALGLDVPVDLYESLIKECIEARDTSRALELHAHINRSGVRPSLGLRNRLLLMYVSCGCMENARQLLDDMPVRDSNSWAVIVAGYAVSGDYEAAIEFFILFLRRLHFDGIDMLQGFPVSWMLVCILDACVHTSDLEIGKQIHGWLLKSGYLIDLFLSSSLINFYGKLGWSKGADLVFNHTSQRNVVVWTARIVNNCREEQFDEVMCIFKEMGKEGIKKNSFTFSSVLRACAKMNGDTHCGEQVHAHAIKLGLASESYVQCSLVNMYGKFGFVRDANTVFLMNGVRRNDACWNAMLTAYIRNGFFIEAIKLLYEMKAAGVQPHELLLNELRYACQYGDFDIRTTGI